MQRKVKRHANRLLSIELNEPNEHPFCCIHQSALRLVLKKYWHGRYRRIPMSLKQILTAWSTLPQTGFASREEVVSGRSRYPVPGPRTPYPTNFAVGVVADDGLDLRLLVCKPAAVIDTTAAGRQERLIEGDVTTAGLATNIQQAMHFQAYIEMGPQNMARCLLGVTKIHTRCIVLVASHFCNLQWFDAARAAFAAAQEGVRVTRNAAPPMQEYLVTKGVRYLLPQYAEPQPVPLSEAAQHVWSLIGAGSLVQDELRATFRAFHPNDMFHCNDMLQQVTVRGRQYAVDEDELEDHPFEEQERHRRAREGRTYPRASADTRGNDARRRAYRQALGPLKQAFPLYEDEDSRESDVEANEEAVEASGADSEATVTDDDGDDAASVESDWAEDEEAATVRKGRTAATAAAAEAARRAEELRKQQDDAAAQEQQREIRGMAAEDAVATESRREEKAQQARMEQAGQRIAAATARFARKRAERRRIAEEQAAAQQEDVDDAASDASSESHETVYDENDNFQDAINLDEEDEFKPAVDIPVIEIKVEEAAAQVQDAQAAAAAAVQVAADAQEDARDAAQEAATLAQDAAAAAQAGDANAQAAGAAAADAVQAADAAVQVAADQAQTAADAIVAVADANNALADAYQDAGAAGVVIPALPAGAGGLALP